MELRPILIQGAMIIEVTTIVNALSNVKEEIIGQWRFFTGTFNGYPVVVSKTEMGMVNGSAATVLGIERYNPIAIINQGTAGGHDKKLRQYDIIIGNESINIGSYRSDFKEEGGGVNPLDWLPMKTSVVIDGKVRRVLSFKSNENLVNLAKKASERYTKGNTYVGCLASADQWNKELDRLVYFNEKFKTLGEDMETAACNQIATSYKIPFLGIRIVSNNEHHLEVFAKDSTDYSQEFTLYVLEELINTL
ncbi:MAG: 5'-methylthioadenosine/S-adenosylhomocysteine nucleosidase [Clostridium sp.]